MPILDTYSSQIVTTTARRAAVLASPGSGKTTTLIRRVEYLLNTGVPAAQILVLSHSTATVRELRRRMDNSTLDTHTRSTTTGYSSNVTATTRPNFSAVFIKTAHAYALELVRAHGESNTTGAPRARVLDNKATLQVLANAVTETRTSCRKGVLWPQLSPTTRAARLALFDELATSRNIALFAKLLAYTRTAKIQLQDGVKLPTFLALTPYIRLLIPVSSAYTAIKTASGFISFNDMLVQALQVIASAPQLVICTHLLVDEYQDCGAEQTQLITALAELPQRSIMVFADPMQAIYGFSGSHYTPLGEVLRGVKILRLPVSHRLTAEVAALASAVVKHSKSQAIATTRSAPKPQLVTNTNLVSQTAQTVADIHGLLEGGAVPSQIAVLARTKALLQPVEQALLAVSINTARLGITRDRRHTLSALWLARLTERHTQGHTITVATLLLCLTKIKIDNVDAAQCKAAVRDLRKASRISSLEGRYRMCCDVYMRLKGGVRADPEFRAELTRWQPLCRKFSSASAMRRALPDLPSERLVTGTVHAAKGMEWEHVLIVGVADGQMPSYLAKDDAALAEERRILYVAASRARQTLRMYYAPAAHARSHQRFENLSRFLTPGTVRATYERINGKAPNTRLTANFKN